MSDKEQPNESVVTELPTKLDAFDHAKLKKVSENLLQAEGQVKAWSENKIRAEGAFDLMKSLIFEKYKIGEKDKVEPDGTLTRNA